MADQIRRVGLLKAVGAAPSLVAAVLLAEYLVVALVAAAAGLMLGTLAAPLLIDSSAGLLGRTGAPSLELSTVGLVTAVALGVACAATFVPAAFGLEGFGGSGYGVVWIDLDDGPRVQALVADAAPPADARGAVDVIVLEDVTIPVFEVRNS